MTEHIETPIQRILRENTERNTDKSSLTNIQLIARRLHNVNQLKANFGFTQNDNSKAYNAKKVVAITKNQFSKTQSKINKLGEMIRHSNANMAGC